MTASGEALLARAAAVDLALGGPAPFTITDHQQDPIMCADDLERMLSLERVSDLTSYSVSRIRQFIASGELVAVRWGREYRIRESDLRAFMAAREQLPIPDQQAPGRARTGEAREAKRRRREGGEEA